MKYQFEYQISSDYFDSSSKIKLFEEYLYQAHFLRLSWLMAELSLPRKIFGQVNQSLDGIDSNSGSYQGVICYNYLTHLADMLDRHGLRRVFITRAGKAGMVGKLSTYQFILFMRQAIEDNDYCLPSGYCRQFTNAVEFCIRRTEKMTGNDFDFFHMWDSEEQSEVTNEMSVPEE